MSIILYIGIVVKKDNIILVRCSILILRKHLILGGCAKNLGPFFYRNIFYTFGNGYTIVMGRYTHANSTQLQFKVGFSKKNVHVCFRQKIEVMRLPESTSSFARSFHVLLSSAILN